MKATADTIIRTIVLIFALVNQVLTMTGHSILPISDEQIQELITLLITIGASLVAWWKNNSFTKAAIAGDKVMKSIKAGESQDAEE